MYDSVRVRAIATMAAVSSICAVFSNSPAQSQGTQPNAATSNQIYRLGVDSREICLSRQQIVDDLNSIPTIVRYLTKIGLAQYAANVQSLAYDIRSKPPCNSVIVFYTGGRAIKEVGGSHIEENLAADGHLTNSFHVSHDPLGGGVDAGFYVPWAAGFRFGPYVAFDFNHLKVNQTFPNGSYLGTTSHWYAMAGIKASYEVTPGTFVYALGSGGGHNMTMNINFGGVPSSKDTTVGGGGIGAGIEFKPAMLQGFGVPVSIYAEYEHDWWATAHFNRPAASPLFNYSFRREDDFFRLGFHVEFASSLATK